MNMFGFILTLTLSLSLTLTQRLPAEDSSLRFMTADQMAAVLVDATGYYHPGFEEFASILGRYDARTGNRTNDRPTIMSVLVMNRIASDIAKKVVLREKFLDESDRVVFLGVEFGQTPSFEFVWEMVLRWRSRWGLVHWDLQSKEKFAELYREVSSSETDPDKLWEKLLTILLQDGALYFF